MTIGLVVNLEYPENLELLRAVERRATDIGYVTVLCDAGEFVERGESYTRLLYEGRVDGLLVASALVSDDLVRELIAADLPLVLVNRRLEGVVNSVSIDDARAGALAVEHLAELGHTRIGYIGGPRYADISTRRHEGYLEGLRSCGLQADERRTVHARIESDSGFEAMERLLEIDRELSAVVIWSPTTAVGALSAARTRGYRLPDELSVVCIHDAPIARHCHPPLTVVRLPLAEMAEQSVDALEQIIEGDEVGSIVAGTPPRLVERGSAVRSP